MWKDLSNEQFRSMMYEMMDDVLIEWGSEEEEPFRCRNGIGSGRGREPFQKQENAFVQSRMS